MGKLGAILYLLVLVGLSVHADDNHVHVEQVSGGDNIECMTDDVGVIRCEENCFCDAAKWLCDNEGEECCGGMCQKVTGPDVRGWELQCLPVVDEEESDNAVKKIEEKKMLNGCHFN